MKIYTKVIIDIESGKTLSEESYEHSGPVALSKGGASGGGSTSGRVGYPGYIEAIQRHWLHGAGTDAGTGEPATFGVGASIEDSLGNSPYSGAFAYDPTTDLTETQDRFDDLDTILDKVDPTTTWSRYKDVAESGLQTGKFNWKRLRSLAEGISRVDSALDWPSLYRKITSETGVDTKINWSTVYNDALTLTGIGSTILWSQLLTDVQTSVEGYTIDNTLITNEVTAFDTLSNTLHNARKADFDAQMAAAGVALTSSFVLGRALLDINRTRDSDKFNQDLRVNQQNQKITNITQNIQAAGSLIAQRIALVIQAANELNRAAVFQITHKQDMLGATSGVERAKLTYLIDAVNQLVNIESARVSAVSQGTTQISSMLSTQLQSGISTSQLQAELNRVKIVAQKEFLDRELDVNIKDSLWDINLWQYGANVMAAASGGTAIYRTESDAGAANSSLAGGISGALAGAVAGAPIAPPFGAIGGAILGGLAGGG